MALQGALYALTPVAEILAVAADRLLVARDGGDPRREHDPRCHKPLVNPPVAGPPRPRGAHARRIARDGNTRYWAFLEGLNLG